MKKLSKIVLILLLIMQIGIVKVSAEEDGVKLDKTAEKIENKLNQWEINLQVKVKPKLETQDILLVIDTSGSMKKNGRIEQTKESAKEFINQVIKSGDSFTKIGIIDYSSTINRIVLPTNDVDELLTAIDDMNANGNTASQEALHEAKKILKKSSAENKSILFITDGEPTIGYDINHHILEELKKNTNAWEIVEELTEEKVRDIELDFTKKYVQKLFERDPDKIFEYSKSISSISPFSSPKLGYHLGDIGYGTENDWAINYLVNMNKLLEFEAKDFNDYGIEVYTASIDISEYSKKTMESIATSVDHYYDITETKDLIEVYKSVANRMLFPYKNMNIIDPIGEGFTLFDANAQDQVDDYNLDIQVNSRDFEYDDIENMYVYDYKYKIKSNHNVIKKLELGQRDFLANGETFFNYDDQQKQFKIPFIQPTILKVAVNYFENNISIDPKKRDDIGNYLVEYNHEKYELRKDEENLYIIPYSNVEDLTATNALNIDSFSNKNIVFNGKRGELDEIHLRDSGINYLDINHYKIPNDEEPIEPKEPVKPTEPAEPLIPKEPIDPSDPNKEPSDIVSIPDEKKETLPKTGINNIYYKLAIVVIILGKAMINQDEN